MITLEKAAICDKIIMKFTGNKTWKWEELQAGAFDDIKSYFHIENNIKYLSGEDVLKVDKILLQLTDKGFAILAEITELGYVAAFNERLSNQLTIEKKESVNKTIQIWILIIGAIGIAATIAGILITLYNFRLKK